MTDSAEKSNVSIFIGGELPISRLDTLAEWISTVKGLGTGFNDPFKNIDEVREYMQACIDANEPLKLHVADREFGHLAFFELQCRQLGLTHTRWDDGAPAIRIFWKPGLEENVAWSVSEGSPMLSWHQIRARLNDGTLDSVLRLMQLAEEFDIPLQVIGDPVEAPVEDGSEDILEV